MADQTKSTSRSIYIDSQAAEVALKRLQADADKLRTKIDAGEASGKNMNKELAKLDQVNAKIKSVQQQLEAGLKPTLVQQQNLVRQLQMELSRLSSNDPKFTAKKLEFQKQNAELKAMRDNLYDVAQAQDAVKESGGGFSKLLGDLTVAFAGFQILDKLKDLVKEFFTASIEEATQAEQAVSQLITALENADRSEIFPNLLEAADEFAGRFKALDNDDISGVFTKLIDYGKLTRSEITNLTEVIINYSRKQNISLDEATDVITKALEGSGKALKTYGINIKDATTFNDRLALVIGELADKVRGVESAFEDTGKGGLAKFKQQIKDAEEAFGKLLLDIITPAPTADTAFKDAQKTADELNKSLDPLIARYDVLKGKTKLNSDEQAELNGIIQRIVKILPELATGFDQYGNAIDINKGKLVEFNKAQAEFLQAKSADAIKSLKDEAESLTKFIKLGSDGINRAIENTKKYGTSTASISSFISQANTKIAQSQDRLLEINEKLSDQYKVELPANVKKFVDAANAAKFGAAKADEVGKSQSEIDKDAEIKRDREQKDREAAAKAAEEAAKKAEEAAKKLLAIEDSLRKDMAAAGLSDIEAAYVKIQTDLQAKIRDIYENSAGSSKERIAELIQLAMQTAQAEIEAAYNKLHKQFGKEQYWLPEKTVIDEKEFEKSIDNVLKKPSIADKILSVFKRDQTAQLELDVLQSQKNRKQRLAAQLALLQQEKANELANTELTEKEKLLIIEKYDQEEKKLRSNSFIDTVKDYLAFAQIVVGFFDQVNQAQTNSENAQLQLQIKNNDKKRKDIEKFSRSKVLTETEARRQIAALDIEDDNKKKELEKKQFERNKGLQIAQAGIQGAQNVLKTVGDFGPPIPPNFLGIAAMAFTVGTTIAQIIAITKAKPSFGLGGKLNGPTHAQNNGMPITNPNTGEIQAWVEGDELITNKRTAKDKNKYTVSGTPSQIISSLNKMHGGVSWDSNATVLPFWKSRPYRTLDYSGISKSQQAIRVFENGGVFQSTNTTSATQGSSSFAQSDEETRSLLIALLFRLENPIAPKVSITLKQLQDAQELQNRIIDEATP